MTELLRFIDLADPTPTPAIMRLAWGSPVHVIDVAASMRFFLPDNNIEISQDMEYLHRHPYQYRQALIHALWSIGLRKEAQKAYWQGKLKKANP